MVFFVMEPSPLSILIPLGPKYWPQNSVFKSLILHSFLKVRDQFHNHIAQGILLTEES